MKKFLSLPAHKLIFWSCFVPSLTFVLLYELLFTLYPSPTHMFFKLGIISSRIFYSIVAASIFYFISQYMGVYLPREKKRIKILSIVHRHLLNVNTNLFELQMNLGLQVLDFKNNVRFKEAVRNINPDKPIESFENWHKYLFYLKSQLLDLIRSVNLYHDYLSKEMFMEILIIEQRLMSPYTFAGYSILQSSNLSYAELDLQEILIHNDILQTLRDKEYKKNERQFKLDGELYRKTYYNE